MDAGRVIIERSKRTGDSILVELSEDQSDRKRLVTIEKGINGGPPSLSVNGMVVDPLDPDMAARLDQIGMMLVGAAIDLTYLLEDLGITDGQ
jgi:hypothetical protein